MKINRLIKTTLLALVGTALGASVSMAQTTNILIQPYGTNVYTGGGTNGNQAGPLFGTGAQQGVWQNWFINNPGITNFSIQWDTNNPPPTGDTLGSVEITTSWNGTQAGTSSTFACVDNNFWGGTTFDATKYSSLEFDFKFDTNTVATPAQDFIRVSIDKGRVINDSGGAALAGLANTGAGATNFDGQWHHVVQVIPGTIANVDISKGAGFGAFNNPSATTAPFSVNYWLANLIFVANTNPPPAPTMIAKAVVPGLVQFADAGPNYNRQNIRTDRTNSDFNIDWVGRPKPVTYSFTLAEFPKSAFSGFQAAMTWTPDPASSIGYGDPDWSATNAIWFHFSEQANGSVFAGIGWKTNLASGNSSSATNLSGFGGTNASVLINGGATTNSFVEPNAVGTWSVTFTSDTDMTITGPSGAHTNVSLPPDIAAAYTGISWFFNTSAVQDKNVGGKAVVSSVNITGVSTPVNEDLTDGALNTSFLQLTSQGYGNGGTLNPTNQVFDTIADDFYAIWTLPDKGYAPISRANVDSGLWTNVTQAPLLVGGTRLIKLPKSARPDPNHGYVGLVKRTFTKLLVLLPGETNAPNTVTGKSGTPTDISIGAGGFVNVTVLAVDDNFNPVPGPAEMLHIASTDSSDSLPIDIGMNNGVGTFVNVALGGSNPTDQFTISDVTVPAHVPAVANAVSSVVNVVP